MGRLIDADKLKNIFLKSRSKVFDYRIVIQEIAYAPTVEAIPKADYETRLKADMVAMLTELQLEIEEKFNDRPFSYNHHQRTEFYRDVDEVIQKKINSLKETEDGKDR